MQIVIGIIVICFTLISMIILPPSMGKMKLFLDEEGNVIDGSISEKIFLDINNTTLGMYIVAKDSSKPVLLFLGGGPGIPEYFLEQEYPTGLDEKFVVCYLEYRGTSLSFDSSLDVSNMTTEQYMDDVVSTTKYLCQRFGKEKIYLMGHSFGTYIGLKTAQEYPKLYHAYIAMSQICNQVESEYLAYDYMKEQYRQAGNSKMLKMFENCPIRDSEEAYERYFSSSLRDNAMHDLEVGTMHDMNSVITGIFFPSLRCTVYTPMERINIWRGKSFLQKTAVASESFHFNAFEEVPSLDIPIYFLAGIYDYTCCYSLQKEYYEQIQAPVKSFYTFENSAHSPLFEERDRAIDILKEDILNGTNNLYNKQLNRNLNY